MKRLIALMLTLTLLLCGCGAKGEPAVTEAPAAVPETTAAPTAEPTTEPTTVPTTEPAPVYVNPLNGEILDAPFTGRIFANTVSNLADNIPHVGVVKADILIECYVNMTAWCAAWRCLRTSIPWTPSAPPVPPVPCSTASPSTMTWSCPTRAVPIRR